MAAAAHHARHLGERALDALDVGEHFERVGEVELAVGERQVGDRAVHHRQAARARLLQYAGRQVDADGGAGQRRHLLEDEAGAAAGLDDAGAAGVGQRRGELEAVDERVVAVVPLRFVAGGELVVVLAVPSSLLHGPVFSTEGPRARPVAYRAMWLWLAERGERWLVLVALGLLVAAIAASR